MSKPKKTKSAPAAVDTAVDEVMQAIDAHHFASADVPASASVDFYRGIAEYCTDRARTLKEEHGV